MDSDLRLLKMQLNATAYCSAFIHFIWYAKISKVWDSSRIIKLLMSWI